jgi:hypothetical protein
MTEIELEVVRLNVRLLMIERLALRNAILFPAVAGRVPIEDSRRSLEDWLTDSTRNVEAAIPRMFEGDAATIALYSEEAREAVEKMIAYANGFAAELRKENTRAGRRRPPE